MCVLYAIWYTMPWNITMMSFMPCSLMQKQHFIKALIDAYFIHVTMLVHYFATSLDKYCLTTALTAARLLAIELLPDNL